jgi:cytidine deaminase
MNKNLKKSLELAVVKKPDSFRSSSIAFSKSGEVYSAGNIESDTHLLNISSEQATLALSTANNDYGVYKIQSLYEKPNKNAVLSPIIAKIIIDHQIRTDQKIEYEIFDSESKNIFQTKDLTKNLPFYNPENVPLQIVNKKISSSKNKTAFPKKGNFEKNLKEFSLKGLLRNFPTYDSASGYGSAVFCKDGSVYFAGQYSSFDHRMNIHSEMNAIISALMDRNNTKSTNGVTNTTNIKEITHIGIVSTKFPNTPCNSCGCCRQFISEINAKFNLNIEIICFAKKTEQFEKHFIKDYLPNAWTNKR